MAVALPERLGKYPIVRVLGEGAMGVVYEAFDPVIRRPLAIKTIRRELLDGADSAVAAAARFRNEAQAAGRLSHPGIASVYEFGEEERCAFIAMEYVPGNSLREYFSRRTRFADQDVMSIMVQLLEALEHAHAQGVWHRDIKPANLMITRNGRLKVTDFGVARIEAAGLTLDGSVIGTPGYMAPEQYSGEGIDRRVDIYACGVVFYQLLTGGPPFSGTQESVMYKTLTELPAPPSTVAGAEQFARFDQVVLTALAKKVGERFASAEEFRAALVQLSALPVSASVSEDTLIMDALHPERAGATAMPASLRGSIPGGGARASSPAGAGALAPTGRSAAPIPGAASAHGTQWDATVLAELEARLSRHLGPVARVLVRRAAASCSDVTTLTSLLV
ncbi:MAG: serine/threonine protein kinase, partial [Burkholderiaceae bacterium]|nr:serine/threonine protein kinase [Burkholderiaceae bacterium]